MDKPLRYAFWGGGGGGGALVAWGHRCIKVGLVGRGGEGGTGGLWRKMTCVCACVCVCVIEATTRDPGLGMRNILDEAVVSVCDTPCGHWRTLQDNWFVSLMVPLCSLYITHRGRGQQQIYENDNHGSKITMEDISHLIKKIFPIHTEAESLIVHKVYLQENNFSTLSLPTRIFFSIRMRSFRNTGMAFWHACNTFLKFPVQHISFSLVGHKDAMVCCCWNENCLSFR